jgi:hypothetical protein
MLRLLDVWDPILYVDLHVTDGAQFEHDISNTIEPLATGNPGVRQIGAALLTETNDRLEAQGALPLDFFPSLRDESDPALGFLTEPILPRFSNGYWALRNRVGLLVETHSWKNYATRVRLTHDTIVAVTEITARDGESWLGVARRADEEATRLGGTTVPLRYAVTDSHDMIDFKGYAYTREPSAVSGALALRFDPKTPQIWSVPLYADVRPTAEVTLPKGGYVVPAAHAASISDRLDAHGIAYRRLDGGEREVEVFRADKVERSASTYKAARSSRSSATGRRSDATSRPARCSCRLHKRKLAWSSLSSNRSRPIPSWPGVSSTPTSRRRNTWNATSPKR